MRCAKLIVKRGDLLNGCESRFLLLRGVHPRLCLVGIIKVRHQAEILFLAERIELMVVALSALSRHA